jgi:hypothetical protein
MRWDFEVRSEDLLEEAVQNQGFPRQQLRRVRRSATAIALFAGVSLALAYAGGYLSVGIVPVGLLSLCGLVWSVLRPLVQIATYRRRLRKHFTSESNAPFLGPWYFETSDAGFTIGSALGETKRPWSVVRKVTVEPPLLRLELAPGVAEAVRIGEGAVPTEEILAELRRYLTAVPSSGFRATRDAGAV